MTFPVSGLAFTIRDGIPLNTLEDLELGFCSVCRYVSYSLKNSLKGFRYGSIVGPIKGDTRSLDYGSCLKSQALHLHDKNLKPET